MKLPKKLLNKLSYSYYEDKYVKRPKYSNRSCVCFAKHIHQSILEGDYCNQLFLEKKAGQIFDYTIQHKIEIYVQEKFITSHYVDFKVTKNNLNHEFHEVKGYETDVWKIKRRLVEALYPDIPYIVKVAK